MEGIFPVFVNKYGFPFLQIFQNSYIVNPKPLSQIGWDSRGEAMGAGEGKLFMLVVAIRSNATSNCLII